MPQTIALVISSGWGVRTFLQTDVLQQLLNQTRVLVLTSPELASSLTEEFGRHVTVETLRPFDQMQGAFGRAYERRNYYFRQLAWTRARQAKLDRYRAGLGARRRRLARSYVLEAEAKLFASKPRLSLLAQRERKIFFRDYGEVGYYEALMKRFAPDLVLSTVPHMALEAPPVLVAQRLGIETACWINSWDNLTTKAAYFTHYDHYFVWCNRMVEELNSLYPEAEGHSVIATGVPHFDWYRSPEMRLTRENFCRLLGLEASRPIILYATATPHLAPAEDGVVKQLAADLAKFDAGTRPQLIVRLHPADDCRRLRDYEFGPSVRVQTPGLAGQGLVSGYFPSFQENREFVNSIAHADVIVNLASTITLDACLCDRPVVSVVFDPDPGQKYQKWIDKFHTEYEHYRTAVDCGAVRLARSSQDLVAQIKMYLEDPGADRSGRRKLVELWCGPNDGQAGQRLGAAVLEAMPKGPRPSEAAEKFQDERIETFC